MFKTEFLEAVRHLFSVS